MVRHSCDNTPRVNLGHLFLGTRSENQRDAVAKGRSRRAVGERGHLALLTWSRVREIRHVLETEDLSQQAIADRFGVSQPTVSRIHRGLVRPQEKDPALQLTG